MSPQYSNAGGIPLSLAVFLATDGYEHNEEADHISATSLIKPVRQLVLSGRVPATEAVLELENMLASRMGTAIHDGIERAWLTNHANALKLLGYPSVVIDSVVINPTVHDLKSFNAQSKNVIPIYLEQRTSKRVGKWVVSGKFDFVGEGRLEDFKTTSVYTAIHHTNDDKYVLQGSIYRWLNPEIITQDTMAIQFIFTDWSRAKAMSDSKYPPKRSQQRLLKLMSIQETERYVRHQLSQIEQFWDTAEPDLPLCSDADLWRSETVFKYYKNPAKTSRSTKNFDTKQEAYIRLAEDNNVGIVVERPGQVTACKFCTAFPVCSQKDALIASGDLVL